MNKRKKFITIMLSLLIAIVLGVPYIMGMLVYDGSVGSSQKIKNEEVIDVFSAREDRPLNELENYKNEDLMIDTPNGYEIEAKFISSNEETEDTIIMVHGIESYYFEMLKFAFNYLENGYNVLIYNQRNTGNSGGGDYTFGLYERFDLNSAVEYVKEEFPNGIIGVHGFSMGAATSAMHAELNEEKKNVDFYILDSPYSEMKDAIRLGIEAENIPFIPVSFIRACGNLYTKAKSGFWYGDVEPLEALRNITVPVMLIHGTADTICAPENSQDMYEAIPHNNKELWMIEGVEHVDGYKDTGDEYFKRIFQFINKLDLL